MEKKRNIPQALVQQQLTDRLSSEELSLRQRLFDTEQALASVESELRATVDTALNDASAATVALRYDLASIRKAANDTRRGLEAEMMSLRQQLLASIESAERSKVEAEESAEAAAAQAAETAAASQHASVTNANALVALELALSAAKERTRIAEDTAATTAQRRQVEAAETIAEAERSAKAAEEQAAAAADQARGEQARAQALERTLETTRAALADASARRQAEEEEREEEERRAAAAEAVELRWLDGELDDLAECLRDAVARARSGEWSENVGGTDAVMSEGGSGDGVTTMATVAPACIAERGDDLGRLVGVAKEASAHAKILREALAGTMGEVSVFVVEQSRR